MDIEKQFESYQQMWLKQIDLPTIEKVEQFKQATRYAFELGLKQKPPTLNGKDE